MAFPTRRAGFPSTTPVNAAPGGTVTTTVPYPGTSVVGDLVTVTFHGIHALAITDGFAPPYDLATGPMQVVPLAGSGAAWTYAGSFDWFRTDTLFYRSVTWSRVRGAETSVQVTTGYGWNRTTGTTAGRQNSLITTLAFGGVPDATLHSVDFAHHDSAPTVVDPHAPGPEDLVVAICLGGRAYTNTAEWTGFTAFANNTGASIATTVASRTWAGGDMSSSLPVGTSAGIITSFYLSGAPVVPPLTGLGFGLRLGGRSRSL